MLKQWMDPKACPSLAVLVETVTAPLLIQNDAAVCLELEIPAELPVPANPTLTAELIQTLVTQALAEMAEGGDLTIIGCETANGIELELADSGCDVDSRAKSLPLAAAAIGARLDWRNCPQGGGSVTIAFARKSDTGRMAA